MLEQLLVKNEIGRGIAEELVPLGVIVYTFSGPLGRTFLIFCYISYLGGWICQRHQILWTDIYTL